MPGEEMIMILRLPMISMYFSANNVKTKLVPEMIKPTAIGLLNPISLNSVARSVDHEQLFRYLCPGKAAHTTIVHELERKGLVMSLDSQ